MLSTIFVVLVGLTVALIVFTPLKYYIPGSSTDYKSVRENKALKYRTDSLDKQVYYNIQYLEALKKVLSGNIETKLDTTVIDVPKEEITGN